MNVGTNSFSITAFCFCDRGPPLDCGDCRAEHKHNNLAVFIDCVGNCYYECGACKGNIIATYSDGSVVKFR